MPKAPTERVPKPRRELSAARLLALERAELRAQPSAIRECVAFCRELSPATARAYLSDLLRFCEWLGPDADLVAVDYDTVRRYAGWLERAAYRPASRARKLAALAKLYGHLVRSGRIEGSPVADVARPRARFEPQDKGLTARELRQLLAAAREAGDQEAALIGLLGLAGLRVAEVAGLDAGAVARDRAGAPLVYITRKGREEREAVAIPERVKRDLDAHLAGRTSGPVFRRATSPRERRAMENRGERVRLTLPLSQQRIAETVARLAERAGLIRRGDPSDEEPLSDGRPRRRLSKITPHTLRHTTASVLLDLGVHPRVVQHQLGHRSLETTMLYDRERREEAAEAVRQLGRLADTSRRD